MPSITISKRTKEQLHLLMATELKEKLSSDPKAILQIVKDKYGISFDFMVQKLIKNYKT